MEESFFYTKSGDSPLVVTAIHDGAELRPVLNAYMALREDERLREEDPYTGKLAALFPNHIVARYSRFETDLNRSRDKAIYLKPEDAWGLQVWRQALPDEEVETSLANYDAFYTATAEYLQKIIDRWGYVIVYDLHSYTHRRGGPQSEPADPEKNPEINLGLGNMDQERWRTVIDTFTQSYKASFPQQEEPDIRENVKFEGGHFMHWIHERFGSKACVLSIEFKKTFMDEWTHELDQERFTLMGKALQNTVKPVLDQAAKLVKRPEVHDRATYRTDPTADTKDKERHKRT